MRRYPEGWHLLFGEPGGFGERVHITQMCMPLKPVFSRHEGDGVQITDEPTGNLDSQSSQDVMELLCKASRHYQQTVLMITHNMNLTASADRVFRVSDGKLSELGGVCK